MPSTWPGLPASPNISSTSPRTRNSLHWDIVTTLELLDTLPNVCPRRSNARTCRTTLWGPFRPLAPTARHYLVSLFPIAAGDKKGQVVLLHDLTFADARAREARIYLALALIGAAAAPGLLASAVVQGFLRGWQRAIKAQIEEFGSQSASSRGEDTVFNREIQSLLSELNIERRHAEGIKVEWSPATLR